MLKVDPEFQALIPPLSAEEFAQLEQNLQEWGCLDSLVIWQEEFTLLDGHNRYEICTRLGIEYQRTLISLPNREAAINWIIDHQLGRRNLSDERKRYLRGLRYNREKARHGAESGGRGNQHILVSPQDEDLPESPKNRTSERLAKEYGVSRQTIERDGQYAKAVDAIAETGGQELKDSILNGESGLSRPEIIELAKDVEANGVEALDVLKDDSKPPRIIGKGDELYTPKPLWMAAEACMGDIDLDPCSNSHSDPNVRASNHYTLEDNGLELPWNGRIFCNPPYSDTGEWVRKVLREIEDGNCTEAIFLVQNDNRTGWYQLLMGAANSLCVYRGYLRFGETENSARFGSAVFGLGVDRGRFRVNFENFGWVFQLGDDGNA